MVKGLGLDRFPELKTQFFCNYKKLVYLAQLDDPKIDAKAREAAEYLELEYEKIFTGDSYLNSALKVTIGSPASSPALKAAP